MRSPLRVVSWNIQHGGGRRAPDILDQIRRWNPDLAVLLEFRGTEPSRGIGRGLSQLGLGFREHVLDPEDPRMNAVFVASRYPLKRLPSSGLLADLHRWVGVHVAAPTPFHLFGMHVPNRGEGPKYDFHEAVATELGRYEADLGLAVGDTNSGRQGLDETTRFFNGMEHRWFDHMAEAGWQDIYRVRNPTERIATWHAPGGGGFRLDQAFVTSAMDPRVTSVRYDWGEPARPSDHAALVVDLTLT